jgi:hypothetical protein
LRKRVAFVAGNDEPNNTPLIGMNASVIIEQ